LLPPLEAKIVLIKSGAGRGDRRAAMRKGAEAVVVTGRRPEHGEKLVAELAEAGATTRFV
jgi:hypothetical protein